ncbi:MAG TPA: dihydrolipoamide acetyltransferase family protein [Acidimicrobiales bacterium]|nr:dihydrolipoamide acetyltransferase family protein [Acidimicrobiales bacterium]
MGTFRMPSLGADMDSGTLVEWRVGPGDPVRRGDIVAVVDTEKSTIEVEVFEDGVVGELLVAEGVEVPVGTPLAAIRSGPESTTSTAATPDKGFVRASPRARRLAAESGADLSALAGSGPGGAVVEADVPIPASEPRRPSSARAPERSPARSETLRRAVGSLMARSKREVPHYYLALSVDMSTAMTWLADTNADHPVTERILPAAMLLRATALAARHNPKLNGFWRQNGFEPAPSVHLGVAVALRGGGLVAPALVNADRLPLSAVTPALKDLVDRARTGRLRSSQVTEATITATSLGDLGVDEVFGVIYPPQVALVGFGRIHDAAWAARGMLGVRPVVRVTLAADHRASDGQEGAHLLSAIDRLLQNPDHLEGAPA